MKKTLHLFIYFVILILLTVSTSTFASECGTNITSDQGNISISGLEEPINIVKVFNQEWKQVFECYAECESDISVNNLVTGTYYIRINTYTSDWDPICSSDLIDITVMGNLGESSNTTGFCAGVSAAGGAGAIAITGVDAPWHRIRYRPAAESEYIELCNDICGNPQLISNLIAGSYFIKIDQSDVGGNNHCLAEFAVEVRDGLIDSCPNVSVTGGIEMITITGVTAPWQRIAYRLVGTNEYIEACNDNCPSSQTITGLPVGVYSVKIDQNNNNNQVYNFCTSEFEVTVTSLNSATNPETEDLPNLCAGVTATGGAGTIIVNGANAPWQQLFYRLDSSPTFIEVCNDDCNDPETISGLAPGAYTIKLNQNNNNDQIYNYCSIELNVTVTGTTSSGPISNTNAASSLFTGPVSTENACAVRTATNTTSCDFGDYGLYLNTYTEGLNFFYRISDGQFIEYNDGTARFVGTLTNTNNPEARLTIDVTFLGRTTIAGPDSPKGHDCGAPQDLSTFYYYTSFSGFLTGEGQLEGASLFIQNNGPAFQLGNGANVTEGSIPQPFGGSGWFTVEVRSQASGLELNFPDDLAAQVGDINITLSGNAMACLESSVPTPIPTPVPAPTTTCAVRTATNTTSCDFGDYGLYLNTYTEGLNFFYTISGGQFTEFEDGTARFIGILTNTNNPEARLTIDVTFQGRTTVAGPDSPKGHDCGAAQDLSTFYYYTSFSGFLTGEGLLEGASLFIQNNGPAFQLGNGANVTEGSNPQPFGASGWFTVEVRSQASGLELNFPDDLAAQVGDINITLSGSATACIDSNLPAPNPAPTPTTICAEREATNTNSCDFGEYGIYLNTFAPELNVFYDIIEGEFVEFTDGTARFTATMVNKNDLWMRFQIEVSFTGRTRVAGPDSPRAHTCDGANQDLESFYYYSSFSGTITGTEDAEGALLNISSNGPAFQLGNGANVTERINPQPFGGSGWFTVEVVSEPNNFTFNFPNDPAALVGDINFTLSGNAAACFENQIVDQASATSRQAPFTTFNTFSFNRQIDLEGITNQVAQSDYFVVEKSSDGRNFEAIDKIYNTDLNSETTYFKTIDEQPILGVNYYRINQFYKNGRNSYTEVKKVDFKFDVTSFSIFPNPARNELFINLNPFVGQAGEILVTNHFGQIIKDLSYEAIPSEPIKIDFEEFNNGLYIIQTRIGKAEWVTNKVMVSKLY